MTVIHELVPPIVPKLYARISHRLEADSSRLFDGDDSMFKRLVSTARTYGEYGVGASTEWVYANTGAAIVAVDTSPAWAQSVLEDKDQKRISVATPDCGPVGDWGRPLTYRFRDNFPKYAQHIWTTSAKPDTVLIDGRFRVCCFVTSLLNAEPGCRIIFDDYRDRLYYHVVEELLRPIERCGRQALFQVTADFDRRLAQQLATDFRMVMD